MKLKRILASVLALCMVLSTMSFSVFADDETPTQGYMIYTYDEDGSQLDSVDGTKSASAFNLASALSDLYALIPFPLSTPSSIQIDVYEDSASTDEVEIKYDTIINTNDNTINNTYSVADGITLTIDGEEYVADTAPDGPTEVTTYEELIAALAEDNANVIMMNDITATATQASSYGKAGIVLGAGDVLDGNGKTLTINGANSTWDCAIAMTGGEVKNLTIAGAMRGVFMPGANGDVVIDSCVFKDVIYTFNSDAGSKDYTVTIKNTTLNGWTSFSNVHKSVTFESCTFGEGSGYAFCRPYQATIFTNCTFTEGFELDTTATEDNNLAFNGCTYNGTALSAKNNAMFPDGGKVLIDGVSTDVTNYPPTGTVTPAYTSATTIWGEATGNASESFAIKLYSGETLLVTATLNDPNHVIIDGNIENVTWNIPLNNAGTDSWWTVEWTNYITADTQPTKVVAVVDGVEVAENTYKLNSPDDLNKIYAAVADADGKFKAYYTDVQDAIVAAAPAGTVEILADVTVEEWVMIAESLTIGNDDLITCVLNGLTINGNNHTLTINSIESAGNGGRLFFDATELNIKNLTIKYADGLDGAIGLKAGTIENVTFEGCTYGVMPQSGDVVIQNCTFMTTGTSIYFEAERDGLTVTGCTFENADTVNVILLRGDVEFTNNTVVSGRTVNVVSGSPVVTGNNFNDVRFKVYNTATATIENNKINVLAFNDESEVKSTFTSNTLSADAQAVLDAANFPVTGLSGSGTEEDPYLINNADELKWFRDDVNAGNTYAGQYVKLNANIDLVSENWTPIGNDTNYFMGTFDGGNNTISNMTINVNSTGNVFAGLFGGIKKATVKNLTMTDVDITAVGAKVRAAAVVGIANCGEVRTDATINFENITVDGCTIDATATSGSALLGGVVGYSYPANMKNITVSDLTINGKAEGNEVRAAAINGYVCGQNVSNNGNTRAPMLVDTFNVSNVTITADAYTVFAGGYAPYTYYGYITLQNGNIDGLKITVNAHEAFVGGLVGYFWRSDNGHTVNNVDITNIDFNVTTDYLGETRIGGVVGTSQSPNTKYNDVTVSGKIVEQCSDPANPVNYHAKVGGFVARTYEYAQQTYTNCVADVDVTGSNIAGGFVGNHNSTVSYVNCEAKGDVTANTAGGFAGRVTEHGYTTDVTFDGCSASGTVTGTNVAGGFIGSTANHGWAAWAAGNGTAYGKNITLKDCVAAANVTTTNNTGYCAGVVGEAKVADGKELTLDNVTYTVEPAVYPYIAEVNGVGYMTLQEAIDKANGAEVILVSDTTENITIADGATVVIDLGGKTLNGYIAPCKPASLTISNGSIVNTNADYSAIEINAGTLTLTNVNIESARHAVRIDGAVTAIIDGGTYKTVYVTNLTQHAVNVSGEANVTIKNGTFVGPKGTSSDSGAAVNVQTGATVSIEGGSYSGGKNNTLAAAGTLTVTGGTFDQDPSDYVAEGYAALPDLNGNYVVGEKPTATVNDLGAMTVAEADYIVYGGSKNGDMPLSFVMQFLADQTADDMATSPFADWYGDFVLTFSGIENDSFTADGCYLAGYYGDFGWVKVPVDGMVIENGVRYPVMLGVGLGQKYDYICSGVQDFKCALYLTPEILAANPNIQVNLELAVVDNSQGSDAAANALVNNQNVYSVTDYTYDAEDFVVKEYVAKIGDTYYATFALAYAAARADDTITLLVPVVVKAGETLTLDKAVTIEYTSNVPGEDMITNRGNLVIDGATLVYTNTDTTASNVTVSTISCEPGSVLEVKSGTVKNDSANNAANGIYAYAIDLLTNGSLGDVTATISGGEVISTNYMAIRQFNNGTDCKNTLKVTGGEIYGAKRAIQVHLKNDAAYLEISGGKVEAGEDGYALCLFPTDATHISVTGGEFVGTVYSGTEGFISGGTFDAEPEAAYAADGYEFVANDDGTYGVVKATHKEPWLNKLLVIYEMEPVTTNGVKYYPLHIYAGIDSLNYKSVGFKIVAKNTANPNGISSQTVTTTVYQKMNVTHTDGSVHKYSASDLGGAYMFGREFLFAAGSWSNADTTIYITAYAVTLDGQEITGKTIEISDSVIKAQDADSALFKEDN